jgi:uncharacterized protein YecT (DUF1311 family)
MICCVAKGKAPTTRSTVLQASIICGVENAVGRFQRLQRRSYGLFSRISTIKVTIVRYSSLRLVVFVCITVGLSAQTPNPSGKGAGECETAATTAAMRTCEASRYATAQRELASAYQDLMNHLDGGQQQKLRITQRAWLRFRDANADFQASLARGGTLAPLVRIASLTEMTKARTEELKKEAGP